MFRVGKMAVSGTYKFSKEGAVYSEELDNYYGTQIELMRGYAVQKRAMARVQALHPELQPEKVHAQCQPAAACLHFHPGGGGRFGALRAGLSHAVMDGSTSTPSVSSASSNPTMPTTEIQDQWRALTR